MAIDTFILGGIQFDDFSTPSAPPFGGRQTMAIHKLPGGSRVIDTLGPDDADFTFSGTFWGDEAKLNAEALDAMRMSGVPVSLSWGGRSWLVIISDATIHCHRFPNCYEYSVTVVVAQNNMFGLLGAIIPGIDAMLSADMASAMALSGQ